MEMQVSKEEPGVESKTYLTNSENIPGNGKISKACCLMYHECVEVSS